ncbi:MAG TPA: hypothetical protein VKQ30_25755 [Ktedonobacterales bacterium]|nr:hypothetical protein [Ktedonobacterales bacterium]
MHLTTTIAQSATTSRIPAKTATGTSTGPYRRGAPHAPSFRIAAE